MRSLTALVVLVALTDAAAQTVYKWVDEDGETHYSQTLPPDRVQQEHAQLDREGRVTAEVARAPTAEERAELAERMRVERDASERDRLQAQQDRLFLAAYPTEEAVTDSIDAQRDVLMAEFSSVDSLIEQARVRLNQSVNQAASMQRSGREVPEHLRNDIARARGNLAELNDRRAELEDEINGLDDLLAEELARFRRLTDTGPKPAESDPAPSDPDDDAGAG
ncbi:DUF4124 domain-containing protein [Wenzhouxiangella sp. XN79A]|uniref:DUF4124 domain-containing protein n=1 Tax=Wenzhouxiangella sp. XN79A TaxID=2724193 RepID=UPI00144A84A8|nr:DUF4124 domain-containing protein [Wenzhouxiangella sp. XN79A]NKI36148.1 DUF4124 domain-containing protein [Wenzhouxiangella sp. XN79A]